MQRYPTLSAQFSWDGVVHGDKLRAVRKCRLDLDLGNHFGNAIHHLRTSEQRRAVAHEIGHRAAVARGFHDRGGKVGNGFRIVEAQSAREPPLGDKSCSEDQQLVFFSGCEFHGISFPAERAFQVLQMRGETAARPTSVGRNAFHCSAK
jgi:hypothetical protein